MMILDWTLPDNAVIDAARGFAAVASVLLLVGLPVVWRKLRSHRVPVRLRGLFIALAAADVYVGATEAQQIGKPMLVWRLPLGVLVIVGALVYLIRLLLAVLDGERII